MKQIKKTLIRKVTPLALVTGMVFQGFGTTCPVFAGTGVDLKIEGYQINTAIGAHRTVYSVSANSGEVTEVGLIYAMKSEVTDADMVIGSTNKGVYSYAATNTGFYGKSGDTSTYVMTMTMIDKPEYFSSQICERVYAKKSDGTYTYGSVETLSVYSIADSLYKNSKMSNVGAHDYLYNNILSKVYPSYQRVTYNPIQEQPTEKPTEKPTEAPTEKPTETQPAFEVVEMANRNTPQNINLNSYYDGLDTASSTSTGSGNETMDKLFDNNTGTKFYSGSSPVRIAWKMKEAVIVKNYTLTTANDSATYSRNPKKWQFYGSNDATTWIQLHAVENGESPMQDVNFTPYTFNTTVSGSYQYFMLQVENISGWGFQLSEISLFGDVAPATGDLGKKLDYYDSIQSGTNTINGITNEGVANLFDENTKTKMFNVGTGTIAWKMKRDVSVYSYTLTTANDNEQYHGRNPRSWNLYGSTNGSNWEKLDAVTDSGIQDKNYESYTYNVKKVGKYKYFKMDIATLDGQAFQLSEIALNGAAISPSEYDILFYKDWDKITNKGYVNELIKLFYNSYPRLYKRWGTGTEPKTITFMADKDYDGVAYCAGTTVCVSTDYANGHPTDIGFFSHEITHSVQQYGGKLNYGGDLYWWTENMANYGGFRYFHWSNPNYVQVYKSTDSGLLDWGYHPYGNNKWFFAYMDSRYPTTRDANGNKVLGLIDSVNKLIKDNNTGSEYSDNPYTVGSPINNKVKEITGYDCFDDLRKHFAEEVQNGTWTFTGFGSYTDNWLTEDIDGIPNPEYPEVKGKVHGNTTAAKISNVTSGNNLLLGASVLGVSGSTNDNESGEKLFDGNLSTKWCATMGNGGFGAWALEGAKHWIKIDLGSRKTFNTYTLYNTGSKEGYANMSEWEILVSDDGENWTSVDYQANRNDNISSFDIGSHTARYIAMKAFEGDSSGTIRLYEMQLYNR